MEAFMRGVGTMDTTSSPTVPQRLRSFWSFALRRDIPPTRAFLVTGLTILLGEILSVLFGERWVPNVGWPHETMDILIIMALTLPSLYLFFVRPMTRTIQEKVAADHALEAMCIDLDRQVLERTQRLADLNAALRRSEANYSTVVEHSPTGICILKDDRVVFANHRFFEMSGLSRDAVPGFNPEGLILADDFQSLERLWRTWTLGRSPTEDCTFRIVNADGDVRWISGRFIPIQFHEEPALLGTIEDITERLEADRRLKESKAALQMLTSRLLSVQEEERKRVARDLHDDIGQSLSAIKFTVERAMHGMRDNPQGNPLALLESVVPVIQQTVDETRRICMALRPSILDDLGLIATLNWFTREFRRTYPAIEVEQAVEFEESGIPETLKITLFRIVQESMNNVAKHAQATRISVTLEPCRGELQLIIRDNGIGFDAGNPKDMDDPRGFGLASMRERTEFHDGTMIVTSIQGQGTTVTARWPLNKIRAAGHRPCAG